MGNAAKINQRGASEAIEHSMGIASPFNSERLRIDPRRFGN